jgi:hypothetical protein
MRTFNAERIVPRSCKGSFVGITNAPALHTGRRQAASCPFYGGIERDCICDLHRGTEEFGVLTCVRERGKVLIRAQNKNYVSKRDPYYWAAHAFLISTSISTNLPIH